MKNKGIIITLIILLTIIVFLLIIFLVSYLKGGISFKNGIFNIGTKSSNVIFDKIFEIEDVKNIEIRQNAGDVIFKETPNDNIQVVIYGENEDDVKVDINKNKLTVDYTEEYRFSLFNFGTIKNDIIVYIPSHYSNNIKIKNNYGNCDIVDLENASIDISCNAGNVELRKVKDATVKCDYGNIKINEILNKCDIKANCGSIEIEKISIQDNSTIKADLGNVYINKTNDIYIEADVDLGKTNINKNNRNADITLKINSDCGNITVNN